MEIAFDTLKSMFYFLISERMFNLYGALIGSALAFIGAYYIFQKQRLEDIRAEKNRNEPIIIISHTQFEDIDFRLGFDLVENEIPLNNNTKFSSVTLPFINAGKTPIYDIRYYYEIENLEQLNDSLDSNAPAKASFFSNENNHDTFSFMYETDTSTCRPRFSIKKYFKMISVLMPSEVNEVTIPSFVTAMWNYELFIFTGYPQYTKYESFSPIIALIIRYKDYNNIERELKYNLAIQNKHFKNPYVDFEVITTKIHDIESKKKPSSN